MKLFKILIVVMLVVVVFPSQAFGKHTYDNKMSIINANIQDNMILDNVDENLVTINNKNIECILPIRLKIGDLIFFDIKPIIRILLHMPPEIKGDSNDHVAMYIGKNRFIESTDYSLSSNIKSLNGVQITPWWVFKLYVDLSTLKIGKVKASPIQKLNAIIFTFRQLQEPYQYAWTNYEPYHSWFANPDIKNPSNPYYDKYYYPDDPYINHWTCSELIWAAYLNQGIELDSTPYTEDGEHYYVGPDDVRNSYYVTCFRYLRIIMD